MGSLAAPAAMLLDPLNITGAQDATALQKQGSTVMGGDNVDHAAVGGVNWGPPVYVPPPQQGKLKGFIESMGGWDGNKFFRGDGSTATPPPPPQWIYEQGKGATWGTPERVGATNDFTFKGNAPGSSGFNAHKGNRF